MWVTESLIKCLYPKTRPYSLWSYCNEMMINNLLSHNCNVFFESILSSLGVTTSHERNDTYHGPWPFHWCYSAWLQNDVRNINVDMCVHLLLCLPQESFVYSWICHFMENRICEMSVCIELSSSSPIIRAPESPTCFHSGR